MRGKLLLAGICILLVLIISATAADISEFPDMFLSSNGLDVIIVVGKHAHAEDVIGSIDVALMLQDAAGSTSKTSIAVLDTQVADITSQNAIIIGGPCANTVAAKLLGYPSDCMEGFHIGEARIQLFEHGNGNIAMLVAGATAHDTRTATTVLSDYKNYNLEGKEILIETIGHIELGVTPK